MFKGLNLNHLHLNAVKQKNQDSNNKEEEGKEKERDAPQCTVKSTASDWKKRQYAQYREYELRREVQRRPEHMAQQPQAQYEPYQPSLGPANDHSLNDSNPRLASHRNHEPASNPLKSSPATLVPQGLPTASSQKIRERTKDHRLKGSDLYVARLCWKETSRTLSHEAMKLTPTNSSTTLTPPPSTGSLHDELLSPHKSSKPNPPPQPSQSPPPKQPTATQSRPCYRCISYMHSAGIKRVFWTNTKGEWEGAKVRELVDALETGGNGDGDGEGDEGKVSGFFVTKHEVLMLKRGMMGS
ncbi:hypothetical protein JMJ35_004205 [Cladonia borealis]|uniref:CMP/dCMP-type deaminase domain-containing protein n=1 Tax=Cladonia borealis TaxID=184061 RepID=A0AA39R3N0_9LECA|nr:hypothetical protein JMJ35_004205 [Cladonia borealis]